MADLVKQNDTYKETTADLTNKLSIITNTEKNKDSMIQSMEKYRDQLISDMAELMRQQEQE